MRLDPQRSQPAMQITAGGLPIDINPVKINGASDAAYLDRHTISSTMIGYNEFGSQPLCRP
jgi:hypothetical protein